MKIPSTTPIDTATLAATWGVALTPVACEACGWTMLFPAGIQDRSCPNCYQPDVEDIQSLNDARLPESVLPFAVTPQQLQQRLGDFVGSVPFPPTDLTPQRLEQRLRPVYITTWLVDGEASGTWQAELGFDYQVVSHQERFGDTNGWQSQEVRETRIRWEPRVGRIRRAYQNIPAPATEELAAWETQLGQYDRTRVQPYQPDMLTGAILRLPNRTSSDAWAEAARGFRDAVVSDCRQAGSAEHIREFGWSPSFHALNWTMLLLPLYTTFYTDEQGQTQRLIVHGQTGVIAGARRASLQRAKLRALITLGVALVLAIIAVIAALVMQLPLMEDSGFLGGVALVGGLLVGLLALHPIITVSRFNHLEKQRRVQ